MGFFTCAQFSTNAVMSTNGGFYVSALIPLCKNTKEKKENGYRSVCQQMLAIFYTYEIIKSMGPVAIVEKSLNYFQQGLGSPVLHRFN